MKCKDCDREMVKDDVDTHGKGNRDVYWVCESCDTGCVEKVRDGKVVDVTWTEE